jgi:hypothetical protein
VADQVGRFLHLPSYSTSMNGVLIYHPGVSHNQTWQLTWFDRQGHAEATLGELGVSGSPAILSPDGTRVAAVIWDFAQSISDLRCSTSAAPSARASPSPSLKT